MIEFVAEEKNDNSIRSNRPKGPRLDQFLAERLHTLSLTRIRTLIAAGEVSVNGASAAPGSRLKAGDRVVVKDANVQMSPTAATPEQIPLSILYEDEELIVVNKPAGMLTHPSNREKSGALTNALAHHFHLTVGRPIRAVLIHRLDRDTSGAIVVAKTQRAHRILSNAFRDRRVKKNYLAIVCGQPETESGLIDAPIGSDPTDWPHWKVMEDGRPAQTRYDVQRRFPHHAMLRLEPLTGRTHQIRIHCALIGLPLLGDPIYGIRNDPEAKRLGIRRHILHAQRLAFPHPSRHEEIDIVAPLPMQMLELIKRLGAPETDE